MNGIAEDSNFFSGLADLKFCVDAERRIGVNNQTLLLKELEPVGLDLDVVCADGQCGEIVKAFRIGGDFGADAGLRFRGRYRSADDDGAARIGDHAGNTARDGRPGKGSSKENCND